MFEKAKDDILDDIAALHKLTPLEWETLLQENLWEVIHKKVVDEIYLGAAECTSSSHFNTKVRCCTVDIQLYTLPKQYNISQFWLSYIPLIFSVVETCCIVEFHDFNKP